MLNLNLIKLVLFICPFSWSPFLFKASHSLRVYKSLTHPNNTEMDQPEVNVPFSSGTLIFVKLSHQLVTVLGLGTCIVFF